MATLTRQQIIDLINQYIYTNGNQRITASQMNEILLALAKAFAMDGSAAGIDSVLAAGSNVIAGRKITNADGGSVNLAASYTKGARTYKYLGFDATTNFLEGATYTGLGNSVMGNVKRSGPTRNFLDMLGDDNLDAGEVLAATIYQAIGSSDEDEGPSDGVHLVTIYEKGKSEMGVCKDFIYTNVKGGEEDEYSSSNQRIDNFHFQTAKGPQSSNHTQGQTSIETTVADETSQFNKVMNSRAEVWNDVEGAVFSVHTKGVNLNRGKRLGLSTGGTAATAGLVTLDGGMATIMTTAVSSRSIISLTVQEAGLYMGNIRVSDKVPGTSFTISTSQDIDTCSVFWQIIEL